MSVGIPLILAINMYMVGMQNAIWTYKNTKGLFKYGQYLLLITAAINVVGDIVLGKLWEVFGIYLATAIARLLTNTWYEPYAVFKVAFGKNPILYLKKYLQYLLILIISGGICYGLCNGCHFSLVINIILKTVICSIVPNIVFSIAFRNTEEYEYIRMIFRRVGRLLKSKISH